MEYSLITYVWFFIVYAFLGWCIEVIFQAVTQGKFINRGFLNGPVCPIYGFGMIILLYFLSPLTDNLILLFVSSILLTSTLEFITGFVLEKLFRKKWWDYTEMPFNIKGYICLSFSIMWGLAAVFIINIIHPFIFKFTSVFDNKFGNILLALLVIYFIIDFIMTLLGIIKINKRFRLLQEMAERLRVYSDYIGEDIYKKVHTIMKTTNKVSQKTQDLKSKFGDSIDELDILKLKVKRDKLIEDKNFVHKRLEKAYPNIKEKLSKIEEKFK